MQIDHPILQFKNVSISYTPGKNAVNHVNADIKKNRITAIMGPSGCPDFVNAYPKTHH